jgi:hypothetical protein
MLGSGQVESRLAFYDRLVRGRRDHGNLRSPWLVSSGAGAGVSSTEAGGLRLVDFREEEWTSSGLKPARTRTETALRGGFADKTKPRSGR